MIKKLLLGCLFMTAVLLYSCDKYHNTTQNNEEVSIKTVSMVTFATMAIALLIAYSYKRR